MKACLRTWYCPAAVLWRYDGQSKTTKFRFLSTRRNASREFSLLWASIDQNTKLRSLGERRGRFDQCHVQNAQCVPSRVSMMTGLYAHCGGHRSNWHLLRLHEPHLFKYLYEAGYDIHWYGKNDLLAQASLSCIKEFYEPEGIKRENRYELGDKRFYSFDFETLDCEREEIGDYIKVKAGMDFLHNRQEGDSPFFLFCRFCNRTHPIPPTVISMGIV